jgi:hypothetical protein
MSEEEQKEFLRRKTSIKMGLSDSEEEETIDLPTELKVSKKLSTKTTQTVVLLILILLFLLPLLQFDFYITTQTSYYYGIYAIKDIKDLANAQPAGDAPPYIEAYEMAVEEFIEKHIGSDVANPLVFLEIAKAEAYGQESDVEELRSSEFLVEETGDGSNDIQVYWDTRHDNIITSWLSIGKKK